MLLIRALHRGYKWFLSPLLAWIGGPGSGCRFEPSCSDYMLEAVETHGLCCGGWLGVKRLGRCHPWGGVGVDPVPPPPPAAEIRSSKLEARNKRQNSKEQKMEPIASNQPPNIPRERAPSFRISDFGFRASR